MNPKISNEIDNILNESEEKHSSDSKLGKASLLKGYILRFILGLVVIAVLMLPIIGFSLKLYFFSTIILLIIFLFFSSRKMKPKEEKWWRGERID